MPDRTGTVHHLASGGSGFSDRPPRAALLELPEGVGTESEPEDDEPRLRVEAGEAEHKTVRPDKPAMTLEELQPHHRGAYFATVAMQKNLECGAKEKVHAYQNLGNEFNAAIRETVKKAS